MIAEMFPLLAFVTVVVLARNAFEAYVLEHERRKTDARELARVRRAYQREVGVQGRGPVQ